MLPILKLHGLTTKSLHTSNVTKWTLNCSRNAGESVTSHGKGEKSAWKGGMKKKKNKVLVADRVVGKSFGKSSSSSFVVGLAHEQLYFFFFCFLCSLNIGIAAPLLHTVHPGHS